MITKTCKTCSIEKNTDDFFRNSASGDGYRARCKECEMEARSGNVGNGNGNITKEGDVKYTIPGEKVLTGGGSPLPHVTNGNGNTNALRLIKKDSITIGNMREDVEACDICRLNDVLYDVDAGQGIKTYACNGCCYELQTGVLTMATDGTNVLAAYNVKRR